MCDQPPPDVPRGEQLRLLEGWLPLAQDANERYDWHLNASALEALILAAAPRLGLTRNTLEARAILWSTYQHQQTSEQPHDEPWRRHEA
jgi:hypothetical protein